MFQRLLILTVALIAVAVVVDTNGRGDQRERAPICERDPNACK